MGHAAISEWLSHKDLKHVSMTQIMTIQRWHLSFDDLSITHSVTLCLGARSRSTQKKRQRIQCNNNYDNDKHNTNNNNNNNNNNKCSDPSPLNQTGAQSIETRLGRTELAAIGWSRAAGGAPFLWSMPQQRGKFSTADACRRAAGKAVNSGKPGAVRRPFRPPTAPGAIGRR